MWGIVSHVAQMILIRQDATIDQATSCATTSHGRQLPIFSEPFAYGGSVGKSFIEILADVAPPACSARRMMSMGTIDSSHAHSTASNGLRVALILRAVDGSPLVLDNRPTVPRTLSSTKRVVAAWAREPNVLSTTVKTKYARAGSGSRPARKPNHLRVAMSTSRVNANRS